MADLHAALTEQLRDEVGAVAYALDALIGVVDRSAGERVAAQAPMWAAQILGDDDRLAAQTVIDVMNVLYPATEPEAAWWATPLGRAVARSVGHPSAEVVSYSVAGAMLGYSKQYVHKLVRGGRLTPGPDGGVTVESVRQHLGRAEGPA